MASPDNQMPVVEKPNIGFLLKQVYAAYKEEVNSLTDKLSQANEKISKNTPCNFCITLSEKVENLRNQLKQILQEQQCPKIRKDACVQTDEALFSVTSSENSSKRIMIYTSPRKRPNAVGNNFKKSPAKTDKSLIYNSEEEVVLAPNTPERDVQRESRVKNWLQTIEIPETVDPDLLQGVILNSHCSIANRSIIRCKEEPNEPETLDMDATMLPLDHVDIKEQLNNRKHLENEQLGHSTVSSEDLLIGANLQNRKHTTILADVGNKNIEKQNETSRKTGIKTYKYKGDPVRKKQDRRRLPAQQCTDCAKYYQNDEKGQHFRNICSRHRATHEAPATPENFWELDFPDTQVCRERGYLDKTQKVIVLPRRKRPFIH